MSSSGGSISSYIGSKWATVLMVAALAAGGAVAATVTSGGVSCATSTPNVPDGPDPWGGCFPGPSNTGVPAGTSLTTVSGNLTVTTTNEVVDAKNVTGYIWVRAAGVTIKNSKAKAIIVEKGDASGNTANPRLKVQDSEINCGGIPRLTGAENPGIWTINFDALRVEITHCSDGAFADNDASLIDSYVHAMAWDDDPAGIHVDGFQGVGGTNVTIRHNSIVVFDETDPTCKSTDPNPSRCNGSSAITSNNASGLPAIDNWHVEYNLVGGGQATIYCSLPSATNSSIEHNRFMSGFGPLGGEVGTTADCGNDGNGATADETWSDNLWADGPNAGTAVPET